MEKNISNEGAEVQQEPIFQRIKRMIISYPWIKKLLFSVAFPLMPVWIMLIFTFVMSVRFSIKEYAATLLTFAMTASGAWISDLLEGTREKTSLRKIFVEFFLLVIMCIAAVLYSAYLVASNVQDIELESTHKLRLIVCASVLAIGTIIIELFINSGDRE